MFVKISALFSIFQLILVVASTNDFDSTDSKILPVTAKTYGDIALTLIQRRLDLLQIMNENLRFKIGSLEMKLIQQLTMQGNEFKKNLAELKAALTTHEGSNETIDSGKASDQESRKYFNGNLNHFRGQQLKIQRNKLKDDLEKLKAALINQKESIKSLDAEKASVQENNTFFYENIFDIRSKFTNENQKTNQSIYRFDNITKPTTAMPSLTTNAIS